MYIISVIEMATAIVINIVLSHMIPIIKFITAIVVKTLTIVFMNFIYNNFVKSTATISSSSSSFI